MNRILFLIKVVLIIFGFVLELFYLGEIFSSSMTAPYTGPVNSLFPLMTLPFIFVCIFRPRLGGTLLVLLSLVSALDSFLTLYGWYGKLLLNFGALISGIKYFGPILFFGISFLIMGVYEINIERKKVLSLREKPSPPA